MSATPRTPWGSDARPPLSRTRRLLASGWIPTFLVFVVASLTLRHMAHVGGRDILVFTAWWGWTCTIPGTVAWRVLDWRGGDGSGRRTGRPLLEDLVLGSTLGVILAVPAYLLAVMSGEPRLVLLWPLLVLGPAALLARGRALMLRRQAQPTPVWWSWSLAAVMLYVLVYTSQSVWGISAVTPVALRAPYVDEPYHLALLGEFRHHFPAEVPFVDGTPLRYHWLVYPFLAAGTWGSGVAPIVLLKVLVPAALIALLVLGVAVAASRISGHRWAAVGSAAVLCALTPLDMMAWTDVSRPWLTTGWVTYRSPTQLLANALCPLLVVLLVGILRGAAARPRHWVATAGVMLAVAGAKSAMLPVFVAGLCGTAVLMLVIRRRPPWKVAGLGVLSIAVFGLATVLFYGSASRAMTFGPFQVIDAQALALHLADAGQTPSTSARAALTLVFVLLLAAPLVGGLGLFVRGGWRRPVPWILLGCWASGLGVFLLFSHPGLAQTYFFRSSVVPAALLSGLGWARAAGTMTRRTATVVAVSLLAGVVWAWLVAGLTTSEKPNGRRSGTDLEQLLVSFGVPFVLALAGVLVAVTIVHLATRASSVDRRYSLLVGITLVLGMCLPMSVATITHVADGPQRSVVRPPMIEPGGLEAATWLREHSQPDDLVATNVHTPFARGSQEDHRAFWISAYTERRMLVEGWAYIPPESVGLPSNELTNNSLGAPFWHPERLRLNDEVFERPSPENLDELHRRYGVDWLFADKRRKPDLRRLGELAQRRFSTPDYVVYELGASAG